MRNRKILAMAGVSAMMIGLVACGSKAESNIAESATPAPTAEATPTPEPTEEPAESHDFDSSVNKYKSESDIEIKQYSGDSASDMADCDSGTDIPDTSILYDWLYNNGVTRESVQNDRDSGCKNPYLDGYLEYLDSLVDKQIAEDNSENTDTSSAKGDGLGGTEIIGGDEFILDSDGGGVDQAGVYYTPHQMEGIKQAAEKQEANKAATEKLVEQMHKDSQELNKNVHDQEWVQDFLNELHSGE